MTRGAAPDGNRVRQFEDKFGQEIHDLLGALRQTLRAAQSLVRDGVPGLSADEAVEEIRAQVAKILGAAHEQADRIVATARHLGEPAEPETAQPSPATTALSPVREMQLEGTVVADIPVATSKGGFAPQLDATDDDWLTYLREAVNDRRSLEELSAPTLAPVTGAAAAGAAGNAGDAGAAGNAGDAADAGAAGNAGDAADAGAAGNAGDAGDAGDAGNAGDAADAGATGATESVGSGERPSGYGADVDGPAIDARDSVANTSAAGPRRRWRRGRA